MAFDRTTILAGPCTITRGGATFMSQGDVVIKPSKRLFQLMVDAFGKVDSRLAGRMLDITYTPDGRWRAAEKAEYFPGGSKVAGESWIGASDSAMVIAPLSGKPVTIHNTFLRSLPQLVFSANKTLIGPVTYGALGANNVEFSNAASLLTVGASGTVTSFTGYAVADIITKGYTLTWGAKTGFVGIHSIDGIVVDHELEINPFLVDAYQEVDMRFQRLDAIVKARLVGPTEENVMDGLVIQGSGAAIGVSEAANAADVIIKDLAGTTIYTANTCGLVASPYVYSARRSRFDDEFEWQTNREFNAGALVAPFVIA